MYDSTLYKTESLEDLIYVSISVPIIKDVWKLLTVNKQRNNREGRQSKNKFAFT